MAQPMNVARDLAAAPPVVGKIEILMTADGAVRARGEVPNIQALIFMLGAATIDLGGQMKAQAKAAAEPKIEVPGGGGLLVATGG
jgi:hypothetical protein